VALHVGLQAGDRIGQVILPGKTIIDLNEGHGWPVDIAHPAVFVISARELEN
jgi:hypothetical protein